MANIQDGILAIDKPAGISSAAVVARVKRTLGVRKVGHTGTLDPFATGLMLCGIGKGTKLSRFLLGSSKRYVAGVTLGVETDTLDVTGAIVAKAPSERVDSITLSDIDDLLHEFRGEQMQHPPVYSALKHQGKPLYQLAREGRPVQKPPRPIEIHGLELFSFSNPHLTISVHCSAGTYIRSLAHDMGKRLGCGALLSSLRRTETCGFSVDAAIPLDHLENMERADTVDTLVPMAEALSFMPAIYADETLMTAVKFGRPFHPAASCGDGMQPAGSGKKENFSIVETIQEKHHKSGSDEHRNEHVDPHLSLNRKPDPIYYRVIDDVGNLAAVVALNQMTGQYDYCCVLVN